jgi:hypothetical protein
MVRSRIGVPRKIKARFRKATTFSARSRKASKVLISHYIKIFLSLSPTKLYVRIE